MLPEILSPAGTPEAFSAALGAGADAIYVGCPSFNARINAGNFDRESLADAIRRAHALGTKVYITLNTLLLDREISDFLGEAEFCYMSGADAAIVADLGGAAMIRKYIPELELHASTQLSGHTSACAEELSRLGFSRMVCARETSYRDLRELMAKTPIEIEMFVHGALCVSHSGQCLFSSMVGARSGNRGLCAQPCRLPYSAGGPVGCGRSDSREEYPLSLKDLSLARYIPEIIELGVSSLKIEGRMKSPEYVAGVTAVWRKLIDERRAADESEMKYLAELFSRDGFTDGYFKSKINSSMLGVRSSEQKELSRRLEHNFKPTERRAPIDISARVKSGEPLSLTMTLREKRVSLLGEVVQEAKTAPLTRETVERNLSKLGATPFEVGSFALELDENAMVPISALNSLRRAACEQLLSIDRARVEHEEYSFLGRRERQSAQVRRTARYRNPLQISRKATEYFDLIYLPLEVLAEDKTLSQLEKLCKNREKFGAILPPVIFDSESQKVREMIEKIKIAGIRDLLVGNLGHLVFAREADMLAHGDFRLNLLNSESRERAEALGFCSTLLSPELSLPQLRDIAAGRGAIVYGRIPLMILEKCAIREIASCDACATDGVALRDRRGIEFPIMREFEHRNVVYNSLPLYSADMRDELSRANLSEWHFIFSIESRSEADSIIEAYKRGEKPSGEVRRMGASLKQQDAKGPLAEPTRESEKTAPRGKEQKSSNSSKRFSNQLPRDRRQGGGKRSTSKKR